MTTTIRSLATSGVIAVNGVDQATIKETGQLTVRTPGVAGNDAVVAAQLLGLGQTWQQVLGSRALNTTYTNSTGKPIQIYVVAGAASALNTVLVASVGGVSGMAGSYASGATGFCVLNGLIVPAGATYSVAPLNGTVSALTNWLELR